MEVKTKIMLTLRVIHYRTIAGRHQLNTFNSFYAVTKHVIDPFSVPISLPAL